MNKMDVKVLAIKREKLFSNGTWEGFKTDEDLNEVINLIESEGEYIRRGDLEEDESYKQIIAQIVLVVGNKLFLHRIPSSGSESRLQDMWPIFLGGHVDYGDESISKAMEREFREEIDYQGKIIKKEFAGLVNLEDNPVNRVHTGLVWVFKGDSENFKDNQDDGIAEGKFVTWGEADKMRENMTYWSKEAFPMLKEKFAKR